MAETLCLLGKVSFDLKIQRRKFTNEGLAFWVIRKPKFWQIRDTCPIRIAKDCHKFPTKFHTQEKDLTQKKTHFASSGNRTRAARVAGEHSTTEPTMLECFKFRKIDYKHEISEYRFTHLQIKSVL